jgi:hypothetical protein
MATQSPRAKAKPSAVKMASQTRQGWRPRGASGTHVMQLGAFLSEKNALRAKKAFLAREKSFADADVAITKATVDQRQFWRVSVNGLSANTASNKCATIRKAAGLFRPFRQSAQSAVLAMVTPKRRSACSTTKGLLRREQPFFVGRKEALTSGRKRVFRHRSVRRTGTALKPSSRRMPLIR